MESKTKTLAKSMRLPFLVLTPACVFLGWSTAIADHASVIWYLPVLALLGAILAHIGVNTLNEYSDFKSGLDFKTSKTPFSGGSGALPRNPDKAAAVLIAGVVAVTGCLFIGGFFAWKYGWGIIPIGLTGLALIVAYTNWITKSPLLCLISPGLGFGILMVVGTHFAMTGEYSTLSWLVGTVPFFLTNNLLLLNQYPDIQADREIGRYHLPIAWGTGVATAVYAVFVISTIAVILGCVFIGLLPVLSLAALLPMPLALFSISGAIKHGGAIGDHPHYLGANVVVAVLTPALLGLSIVFG